MFTNPSPHVIAADVLDNSVILSFDNGKSAIYPAALLYSVFSQADEVIDFDPEAAEA